MLKAYLTITYSLKFKLLKRFTIIFMLFTYLLFNAGISISMHYCGNTLTSTEFFATNKGCICSTPEEEPHSCCKDVQVESSKDDQKSVTLYKLAIEKVVIAEVKFFVAEFIKLYEAEANLSSTYHSPPFYKVPLFIFNQIFRL